jgi:hypothetical protein
MWASSGFRYAHDYSTNDSSTSSQISICLEIPRLRITWKPAPACLFRWSLLGHAVKARPLHFNNSATPSFTSHTPQICRMWIHTGRTAGGSTCESWLELAHDFICGVKKVIGYVCIANRKRIVSKHARMQGICSQSARYLSVRFTWR